jgi:hypothetical protein
MENASIPLGDSTCASSYSCLRHVSLCMGDSEAVGSTTSLIPPLPSSPPYLFPFCFLHLAQRPSIRHGLAPLKLPPAMDWLHSSSPAPTILGSAIPGTQLSHKSLMSTHASVLVDSVGPPSTEVCRAAASLP